MGFQEAIKTDSVTRKMQSWYTNPGGGSGGGSGGGGDVVNVRRYFVQAGENINAGNLYSIGSDGKAYNATAKSTDNKYAVFAALVSAESGDLVEVVSTGKVTVTGAAFTPGEPVYLRSGLVNISSAYVEEKTAEEDVFQIVGEAVDAETYIVRISEPIILDE